MYLEQEDQDKIKEYLIINQIHLQELEEIQKLTQNKDECLKQYDSSFHEDVMVQYLQACRIPIAEDVGRNTGLSVGGILYVLDCLGIENFKTFLGIKTKPKLTVVKGE